MALFKKIKQAFTGPVGPVGAMGEPGPTGTPGERGLRGPQGLPGSHAEYTPPVFRVIPRDKWKPPTLLTDYGNPQLPVRAHAGDAGWDLYAPRQVVIPAGNTVTVFLCVAVELGPDTMGKIEPRSSMNGKGIFAQPGVVDSGYTGEIGVTLFNSTGRPYIVQPGSRIAQMVVYPVVTGDKPARDTARGSGGFGSTNVRAAEQRLFQDQRLTDQPLYTPPAPDMVNHPPHYAKHPVFSGECHDFTRLMPFDQGNSFKYAWRCDSKGDVLENLRKCKWYLDSALQHIYATPLYKGGTQKANDLMKQWVRCPQPLPERRAVDLAYLACVHILIGENRSLQSAQRNISEAIALLEEKVG